MSSTRSPNPPAPPLSEERFRELLDAYGARTSAWPPAERAGCEALLASSEWARAEMQAAAELDAALFAAAAEPVLAPSVERRLNELPIRNPSRALQSPLRDWLKRWLWAPALGFSVLTALAVVWGSRIDEAGTAFEEDSATASDSLALELALGVTPEFEDGEP